MTRYERLAGALALGMVLGVGDALAIRIANPASFAGTADTWRFLFGATAPLVLLAAVGGGVAAMLPSRLASPLAAIAPGLCLFAWCGVRVHVRWFFGVPLLDPTYAAVNAALFLACAGLSAGVWRLLGAGLTRRLRGPSIPAAAVAVLLGAVALARPLPPPGRPPVPGGGPPPGARDMLLVTLDTTRADHLSSYGYPLGTSPALDRLARRGIVWTEMIAPIPLTNPSHSSLFTGEMPRAHGVRNNGTPLKAAMPTFVDELAATGWNCAAFVSGIPLKASLSGLARSFARYDDRFSPLEAVHPMMTSLAVVRVAQRLLPFDVVERRASDTARAAGEWLHESASPRFVWVHFFDAHTPYDAPAVLRDRFARGAGAWSANGQSAGAWPIADYDAEILVADRALDELVRTFDEVTGGRGVVVVTADHGEGLGQHGELAHGSQLYTEDLRVPCVAAGVTGGPVWRTELASLRTLAGLIPAWARAARPVEEPTTASYVFSETFAPEGKQDQSAVWHESGRKLMVNWATGEELAFDRRTDPGETTPVAPGDAYAELRSHLEPPRTADDAPLDPEVVRRLRALGYLH